MIYIYYIFLSTKSTSVELPNYTRDLLTCESGRRHLKIATEEGMLILNGIIGLIVQGKGGGCCAGLEIGSSDEILAEVLALSALDILFWDLE